MFGFNLANINNMVSNALQMAAQCQSDDVILDLACNFAFRLQNCPKCTNVYLSGWLNTYLLKYWNLLVSLGISRLSVEM